MPSLTSRLKFNVPVASDLADENVYYTPNMNIIDGEMPVALLSSPGTTPPTYGGQMRYTINDITSNKGRGNSKQIIASQASAGSWFRVAEELAMGRVSSEGISGANGSPSAWFPANTNIGWFAIPGMIPVNAGHTIEVRTWIEVESYSATGGPGVYPVFGVVKYAGNWSASSGTPPSNPDDITLPIRGSVPFSSGAFANPQDPSVTPNNVDAVTVPLRFLLTNPSASANQFANVGFWIFGYQIGSLIPNFRFAAYRNHDTNLNIGNYTSTEMVGGP